MDFRAMIRDLAEAKQRVDNLNETHKEVLDEIASAKKEAKKIEENTRARAKIWFEETGDRTPHDALSIKRVTHKNYSTAPNIHQALKLAPQVLVFDLSQVDAAMPLLARQIVEFQDELSDQKAMARAEDIVRTVLSMLEVDGKMARDLEKGGFKWNLVSEEAVDTVFLQSRLGQYLIVPEDEPEQR